MMMMMMIMMIVNYGDNDDDNHHYVGDYDVGDEDDDNDDDYDDDDVGGDTQGGGLAILNLLCLQDRVERAVKVCHVHHCEFLTHYELTPILIQNPAEDDGQRPQGGHRGEPRPPRLRRHGHDQPQGATEHRQVRG